MTFHNTKLFTFCIFIIGSYTSQASHYKKKLNDIQSAISLAPQNQQLELDQTPDGLSTSEWQSIQKQIQVGKYKAYPQDDGGFISANPANGWRINYGTDGTTTLSPYQEDEVNYSIALRLDSVGSTEQVPLTKPEAIWFENNRMHYRWNEHITEFWINSEQQLEQWFQVEQRPEGQTDQQPLTVNLQLETNLEVLQSGNRINLKTPDYTTIHYEKLKVWDTNGVELEASMHLQDSKLSLVINDQSATYPLTIDPAFSQQAYIKASNTGSNNRFGSSVAIDGDTLVVGAGSESSNATGINGDQSNNSLIGSGAVYVFTRTGTGWSQQAYIKASNTAATDFFGDSVAIDGHTLVVGARGEDSNATGINGDQTNNSSSSSGAVYVFTRSGTSWSQQAYIKASNPDRIDSFGGVVAIDGDTLVVGALGEDSNATGINGNQANEGAEVSGAVYVFTRSGTSWSQQAYIKASNTGAGDRFGASVAIGGDTLVVGAWGEGSNAIGINGDQANDAAALSGAVYVFTRSGVSWSQQAYIKASNNNAEDRFGSPVAIDGDTLVVGAVREGSNATGINGDQANEDAKASGAVYVFTRSGSSWSQQAYIKASNTDIDDWFGFSVALQGDTLVVGARGEDSNATGINGDQTNNSSSSSGAVYMFTRSGSSWSQQAYIKASNTGSSDLFGESVAIDGNTLVVGADHEQSNATGINGDQNNDALLFSGAVYAFNLRGFPVSVPINRGVILLILIALMLITAIKFNNSKKIPNKAFSLK